jgi:hypothetical protein
VGLALVDVTLVDLASHRLGLAGLLTEVLRIASVAPEILNSRHPALDWAHQRRGIRLVLSADCTAERTDSPRTCAPQSVSKNSARDKGSWLSFRVLETPFIPLKRRWTNFPQATVYSDYLKGAACRRTPHLRWRALND